MKSAEELQIGDWYARDTVHDLYPIETQDDLDDARNPYPPARGWATLDDALADLLAPFHFWLLGPEELDDHIAFAEKKFGVALPRRDPNADWQQLCVATRPDGYPPV